MGVIKRMNPSGGTCWGIQWFDESGKRRREFHAAWKKRDAEQAYGKIAARRLVGFARIVAWPEYGSDAGHSRRSSCWSCPRFFQASVSKFNRGDAGSARAAADGAFP